MGAEVVAYLDCSMEAELGLCYCRELGVGLDWSRGFGADLDKHSWVADPDSSHTYCYSC